MRFLIRWLLNGLALLVVAWLLTGVHVNGWQAAVTAGLGLGLVNALIRPIIKLLALPITILTLGLFGLVINAGLFWLVSELVQGFAVDGFIWALAGAVLVAIFAAVFAGFLGVKK
ncbi:MAG: phage holin family protein [Firmicutes bacterium]|nr:phage holin family protein [Bacillota bacterium]